MTTSACFTCVVATGQHHTPGGLVYASDLVVVNHRDTDVDDEGQPRPWPGWLIVSPRRHLTRTFDMTCQERDELFAVVARADQALTSLLGARRCMVASLGWWVDDHLHTHVVPTYDDPTQGWKNFGRPPQDLGVSPAAIAAMVAASLAD